MCIRDRIRSKNSLCVSPALSIRFSNASTRASVMHSCGLFVHWFSIGKWGGLTRPVTSFLISPAGTRFQSAGSCTSYFPFQLSPVFLYCHAISNTVIAPPRHSRDKIHVRAELLFLRRFRLRFRRSGGRRNIHQHAVLNRQLAVRAVIRAQGSRLTGTATHSVLVRGGEMCIRDSQKTKSCNTKKGRPKPPLSLARRIGCLRTLSFFGII